MLGRFRDGSSHWGDGAVVSKGRATALSREGRSKSRRAYSPAVEALEALKLLDRGAAPFLPTLAVEHGPIFSPLSLDSPSPIHDAWDAALGQTTLDDLLAPVPRADASGLDQLNRYLSRSWFRAGIAPQLHDDCTQGVYVTLLENLGRDGFDDLTDQVGRLGVREVLNRDTDAGPDFFRAVDMVKKRTLRQKSFAALDDQAEVASPTDVDGESWRVALQEAIRNTLNPRETELVYATLRGNTPSEIALLWGVAPKTVSNEKTRVIQKLREALTADLAD